MKKKSSIDEVVEIRGKDVILKKGERIVRRIPLEEFVDHLAWNRPRSVFPDGSPIPNHVRFIQVRGDTTLVVLELFPQVRQVRWVSAESKTRFGEGTDYRTVNLAFPFIVIPLLFSKWGLCNYQQLFYRTHPLSSLNDEIYLPNLLNVAPAYEYISCFCLKGLESIFGLPMEKQIQKVIEFLWEAGWNESMDAHSSYWNMMRRLNLDPKISSLERWERATREDPLFVLQVPWKSAGVTLQEVVSSMFHNVGDSMPIKTASDLVKPIMAISTRRLSIAISGKKGNKMV